MLNSPDLFSKLFSRDLCYSLKSGDESGLCRRRTKLMEALLSICVGLGLSAACGFRVFVPLLVMSIAAHTGQLHLSSGFQWIGSDLALASFALATALEIGGYYIPWLDHLLDTAATPAAIIAGTIVTASMATDFTPFLKWTMAAIAGGGVAGLVQGTTVLTRGASTMATGGLGNPIFATLELGGAVFMSFMAIWIPIVAIVLLGLVIFWLVRKALRLARKPQPLATR
jgi:hypothetical protein